MVETTVSGLREGEIRRLDLDVGSFLPGEIVGRVYLDGEVLANQTVSPLRVDAATGFSVPISQPVPTDAAARSIAAPTSTRSGRRCTSA